MVSIGDTYKYRTIFTQEDVEMFADLTGDRNPIHLDREYAARTHFKKQIVQSALISCAISKIFGLKWPAELDSHFISNEVMYIKPVYVEEPYEFYCNCTNIDSKRHIGTIESVLYDMHGNVIVNVKSRIESKSAFKK
ncbi:MAG: MaoC/PaaZ C-terminal domain-containing protein [Bacteroidales bacterium]